MTRHTLPVRSPLPNRQPSTRSAPAITRELGRRDAAAAVVVRMHRQHDAVAARQIAVHPLDLVGEDVRRGHLHRGRQVDDRLVLRRGLPDVEHRVADSSLAKSSSVPVKLSGEYWNVQSVSGWLARAVAHQLRRRRRRSPRCPSRSSPNTTRRCVVDVELYRCMIARLAPCSASKVRSISGARACVSTCTLTSSGIRSSSISRRTKSKSVCEAAGKADLDFLVAHLHQQAEHAQLALRVHRLDQRLVAVAQVDAAPDRRSRDRPATATCGRQDRSGRTVGT